MDTKKPEPSTDGGKTGRRPERPSSGVSSVRRKLVKSGAFVPPIVLTLRSGAAVAQGSGAVTCLATNQQVAQEAAEQNENFGVKSDTDEWLRSRVLVKEARRVRKRRGVWTFKGNKVVRVYAHENADKGSWLSLRPGRLGKKWRLRDTGRVIEVKDAASGTVLIVGHLLHRAGNPLRRFIGIAENEAYGLVEVDENGNIALDEDGNPSVTEIVDSTQQVNAVTASCWASLNPTANI